MRTHDEKKLSKARRLFARKNGATVADVATECGVAQRTVERWLRMWSKSRGVDVARLGVGRPVAYRVTVKQAA